MGWIGKAVGGTLGFIVGGPVGAAIGAGIGHGVDAMDEENVDIEGDGLGRNLDAEAASFFDEIGMALKIDVKNELPANSFGLIQIMNSERDFIRGHKPFQHDDGLFLVTSPISERSCQFYLPRGAIRWPNSTQKFGIVFSVVVQSGNEDEPSLFGTSIFEMELPPYTRLVKADWLSPLIGLCMEVVHADGRVLSAEVRMVRNYFQEVFELEPSDLNALKIEMKKKPTGNLQALIDRAMLRLPRLSPPDILAIMADISKCDGEVHEREVEVIRRAALLMGLAQENWTDVAAELGLSDHRRQQSRPSTSSMSISEAQKVLGISNDASAAEIQAAYRKLVADYHPDRVAFMPKEFQDLAHQKMTEINAAYARVR